MSEFLLAFSAFLALHALPAARGLRSGLIARLGRRGYLITYSAVSLLLLAWLIHAALRAESVLLWYPSPALAAVPLLAMPLASILLVAGLLAPNPLSISLARGSKAEDPPAVAAITRHPVLWAMILWAFSHVAANGDFVSVILFGGLGLYALIGCRLLDRRRRNRLGEAAWRRLAEGTSNVPFAALISGRARLRGGRDLWLGVVLGMGFYALLLAGGHLWLFGVDPLVWFNGWSTPS